PRAGPPAARQPAPHGPGGARRGPAPGAAAAPGPAAPGGDRRWPARLTRCRPGYGRRARRWGVSASGRGAAPGGRRRDRRAGVQTCAPPTLPRAVPPAAEQPPPHGPTGPPRGPAPCAAAVPGPAAPWDDRYSPVHVTRSRHEYEWLNMQLGVYTSGMVSTPVVATPPATAPASGAARRPRAAVVGASGYAGGETLRLLAGHPDLEVATVTAHSSAGKRLSEVAPHI